MLRALILTLVFLGTPVFLATSAFAVQPDEMLADPALEARAREISALIRCPVCQGETIDDSNATIAKDLRLVVRERLLAGDSDDQVIDYLVARYGEFILFSPRATGANLVLWLAGPALLAGALFGAGLYIRRRRFAPEPTVQALSPEEQARLTEILKG